MTDMEPPLMPAKRRSGPEPGPLWSPRGRTGAVGGPLLLTHPGSLREEVRAEISRLGATKAYVLGGTGAVSSAVEEELVSMLGRGGVVRLGGTDRYVTARLIADEVIRVLGGAYSGDALVATGSNFPDAAAGAAVAAALRPIPSE